MLEELKQIGILFGKENEAIAGSNIKTGFLHRMSREEIDEFCQPLEVLLVAGAEKEAEYLIEECPCALLWFGECAPEMLLEKYDASLVKADAAELDVLVQTFALWMQTALEQGFAEFGEVEDIISRFTDFKAGTPDEEDSLVLWLGSNIPADSEEEKQFLQRAQQLAAKAEAQGQEFYCSYHVAQDNSKCRTMLFSAKEKIEE